MKVLGIHYGHNATVCLAEEGKITFCQSEERFSRLKNSTGFPSQTLQYVYDHLIRPEQVDRAVLFQKSIYGYLFLKRHGFKTFNYGEYLEESYVAKGWKRRLLETDFGWNLRAWQMARKEKDATLQAEAKQYFSNALQLPQEKIEALDHHRAHAYAAVPSIQDWGPTLVFILDAVGDGACATVFKHENGKLERLSRTDHRHSLGYYYSATTSLMGMKSNEHEFKVMGMAPYSKPKYYQKTLERLQKLIRINSRGEFESVPNPEKLMTVLDRAYYHQRFDNICGAIQELTENLVLQWVEYWVKKTGIRQLAVGGGVFMNVKASQRLLSQPYVERMYVVPSAADESCAMGAAVWGSLDLAPQQKFHAVEDLYLGVEYGDSAIEKSLRETQASERYQISRPANINREVGKLLAKNVIVSRCSGRMEFGARALGNRSILARASDFTNLQTINDAIKSRDFWMPFTPSILEEDVPRYVEGFERIFAPYMCITFNSTAEARKHLAAAIHPRDFTLRPQYVRKAWNPDYHELISEYKAETGMGGILNTSFNLHGEPNVCSPEDAIRTVDLSGLTHLALGSFLLEKKKGQG
jgi:carbamoyltransferase